MALYRQDRELTELEINALCAQIEREEEASNVTFLENTMSFYVFQGMVSNKLIKFNLDKQTGLIITEEE
ncbi:hypothetical protein [Metabacillus fastidiosus]|uniref:hypothetical protein n=1 Tax=Metabacillus fastidiosus TaxID=1458 RepID=UPI0008257E28|nr:hypothetical protein [Metabacillus fastidiosus]MED4461877.1 hypothetical protein [Metabacillus fastidiosus]